MTEASDWLLNHRVELKQRRHQFSSYKFIDFEYQLSCHCGMWYKTMFISDEIEQRREYEKHMEYIRFELYVCEQALHAIQGNFIDI